MLSNDRSRGASRRQFLAGSLAAAPLLLAGSRAFARNRTKDRVLVLIRLGGGNDGLNTVIPIEDDSYHRARPTLRVEKKDALPFHAGLAFHPALAKLHRLSEAGKVAVVENVGYPNPDRSHFKSMDVWHTAGFEENPHHGFLAPLVDGPANELGIAPAIAVLDDKTPLALVGRDRAAPVIFALDDFEVDAADEIATLVDAPRRHESPALATVRSAASSALSFENRLRRLKQKSRSAMPGSKLGRSLSTVLDLLAAGVRPQVFYVAHDGFDTHTQQKDSHATLLRDLGDCIAAFHSALGEAIDSRNVLIATFSEFGRRVRENGSRGTDHGAAAPLFVVGDPVAPGAYGGVPDLVDLDDGDVRFQVDFRSVYATLLDRWLGRDPKSCLGAAYPSLPFLPEWS